MLMSAMGSLQAENVQRGVVLLRAEGGQDGRRPSRGARGSPLLGPSMTVGGSVLPSLYFILFFHFFSVKYIFFIV